MRAGVRVYYVQLYATLMHRNVRKNNAPLTFHMNGSPKQDTPSPLYPWLQAQVKLPGMLAQAALGEQLSVPVAHSSISGEEERVML